MTKGYFITIEGPDGAGKSTQIQLMVEYFRQKSMEVVVTREPGGTEIAERIREIILDVASKGMDPVTEALLYAASRAEHVAKVILPALLQGKVVLCDRFVDSSMAYQAFGRGLGTELVGDINRYATRGLTPDLTLFFSIDPENALNRKSDEEMDRLELEKEEFHHKVFEGYQTIAIRQPERIHTIDANRPIETIFSEIQDIMNGLLKTGR